MPLQKGLAAVEARWLWLWQKRGTVKLEPLFGTAVLITREAAQARKTYYRLSGDHVIRSARRYSFQQGTIWVPRWDPLEEHLDPQVDHGVDGLAQEELAGRGMYRLRNGTIVILTYQCLPDAFSFWRQQLHIRLETYRAEFGRISVELGAIEERALKYIFAEKQEAGIAEEFESLQQDLNRRQSDVRGILSRLAERERAAQLLVDAMLDELRLAEIALRAISKSAVMAGLLERRRIPSQDIVEFKKYLIKTHQRLAVINVRPISRQISSAQLRLAEFWGFLGFAEPEIACQKLSLAAKSVEKAQEILRAKKEQVRQLELELTA